jgi:8-oxo-dGTP diphosphatase
MDIKRYKLCRLQSQHRKPAVGADSVVYHHGRILLVKRGLEPFKGEWALPGGYMKYGEKLEDTVKREVFEETGCRVRPLQVIGVYSDPKRDPTQHTVSVCYLSKYLCGKLRPRPPETIEVKWFRISKLPKLCSDHNEKVNKFLKILFKQKKDKNGIKIKDTTRSVGRLCTDCKRGHTRCKNSSFKRK